MQRSVDSLDLKVKLCARLEVGLAGICLFAGRRRANCGGKKTGSHDHVLRVTQLIDICIVMWPKTGAQVPTEPTSSSTSHDDTDEHEDQRPLRRIIPAAEHWTALHLVAGVGGRTNSLCTPDAFSPSSSEGASIFWGASPRGSTSKSSKRAAALLATHEHQDAQEFFQLLSACARSARVSLLRGRARLGSGLWTRTGRGRGRTSA